MAPTHPGYAPNLATFLSSSLSLEAAIESLVALLKRRQIRGPEQCALATSHVLSIVVAKGRWADADQLIAQIRRVGGKLAAAQPREYAIRNIVRRVLGLVRDEAEDQNENDLPSDSISPDEPAEPSAPSPPRAVRPPALAASSSYITSLSMFNLLSAETGDTSTNGSGSSTPIHQGQRASTSALRSEVGLGIDEIKDEITQVDDQVASFAGDQIHKGDFVLVYRPTRRMEKFLIKASKRPFTLLLVEEPTRKPDENRYAVLSKRLSSSKVSMIKITSGGVAAIMPKVNKVILDSRAIVADGGVIADAGAGLLARAASAEGRPVIVLGAVYSLSPERPSDLASLFETGDPGGLVPFADGPLVDGVDVRDVAAAYIEHRLVDIYITNLGPHSRDQLQSVISEHYKVEDLDINIDIYPH